MEALGNTGFATLGSGTLLGVYLPIWLMIGFLVLGYWLTTKTPLAATSTPSAAMSLPPASPACRS